MKSLVAAAALAVSAVALAAPAHADPRGPAPYNVSAPDYRADGYRADHRGPYRHAFSRDDLQRLQVSIDRGYASGRLTRREAARLTSQVADLRQRARHYWRTDGLSWRERRDLDNRYLALRDAIGRELRDRDTRYRSPPSRY